MQHILYVSSCLLKLADQETDTHVKYSNYSHTCKKPGQDFFSPNMKLAALSVTKTKGCMIF